MLHLDGAKMERECRLCKCSPATATSVHVSMSLRYSLRCTVLRALSNRLRFWSANLAQNPLPLSLKVKNFICFRQPRPQRCTSVAAVKQHTLNKALKQCIEQLRGKRNAIWHVWPPVLRAYSLINSC